MSGCVSKSSPAYTNIEKLPQIEEVIKIPMIESVEMQKKNFNIEYKAKNTKPDEANYINARGSIIDLDKRPKVVIALPVENKISTNSAQTLDKTEAFKTEGYISEAEAVVEKELIRTGFRVIDRSKFEAKLRMQREKDNSTKNLVYQEKLKQLNEKLKNKTISKDNFISELEKLKETTVSRNRGDKELIDMSELLIAAGNNGVKNGVNADYVLQLNTIEEDDGYITQLNIKGKNQVDTYLEKNTDITYGKGANNIPYNFDTSVFQVLFSAKLFEVKSGEVVWNGSHELNSLDIEDITASFNISKQDTNSENINNKINRLNNQIMIIFRKSVESQQSLKKLYAQASKKREYKDEKIQAISERNLKNSITKYENIIKKNNMKIHRFNGLAQNNAQNIEYKYVISDLLIEPNLNNIITIGDNQKQKVIKKHRQKLLRKTIKSLFDTINVKN